VLFRQAILAALQAGITRFVEVSPHATLLSHVEHTAAEQDLRVTAVAAGDRHKPLRATLLAAAARAWEAGTELDWEVLYPGPVPVLPSLPTSRLDPTHHWYQDPAVTPPPHAQTTVTSDPPYGAHDSSSLQQWLRALVAEVAGFTSIAEVDLHRPATELDVDSAAFVEVKNRLEDHLQVAVPITLLLDGASLADVAEALTRHGGADRDGTSPTSDDPLARLLGGRRVEDLTEDEIDGLLAAHGGSDSA
jgi:acyl transferase domain-containing protein